MLNTSHSELYQRLQNYQLDDRKHEFGFTKHLIKNHGWTEQYAARAIAEYKKFAFLTVVAKHQIVPSDAVDQVWHAHLLLTQSYWSEFCPQILQKDLHHHPARGGKSERAEFHQLYLQTIASYHQYFGTPPTEIWSPPEIRFGKELKMQRVSRTDNWIIPKQLPQLKPNIIKFSLFLGLFTCMSIFFADLAFASQKSGVDRSQNSLNLIFALILVIFSLLLHCIVRSPSKQSVQPALSIYQVAYLAGGRKRAVELAILRLVQQGYLLPNVRHRSFTIAKKFGTELNQLEREIMEWVRTKPEFDRLRSTVLYATDWLRISLQQEKLLVNNYLSIGLVACHIFTIFLCYFLFNLGGIFVFVLIPSYTYLRSLALDLRTYWGDRILRDWERSDRSFDPIPRFALYGESTLSGGAFDDLRQIYKVQQQETDTGGCGCGC